MTGPESEVSALASRAESAAGFGSVGDDAELETDLDDHLRRVDGAGWELATSCSLDPDGRSPIRETAWWLAGRGLDVCALHAGSVDAVAAAIDNWLGDDGGSVAPEHDELPEHEIDVIAVDAAAGAAYLVQVTTADLDDLDDVSDDPLRSLVRTELWLSSDEVEIVPAVAAPESAFGVFEREPTGDESDAARYEVRRTDPPGEPGPTAAALTLGPPKADALNALPPCDGAIAGAAAIELLREQTASGIEAEPSTQRSIRRRVEEALDVGALGERFTAVITDSPLFSRVTVGPSRYMYLNPGGAVTAAALQSRLGFAVSTSEAMDAMRDSKKSFGRTLSQVEQQVQEAKRREPGRPYGVLPDLFDDRTER